MRRSIRMAVIAFGALAAGGIFETHGSKRALGPWRSNEGRVGPAGVGSARGRRLELSRVEQVAA